MATVLLYSSQLATVLLYSSLQATLLLYSRVLATVLLYSSQLDNVLLYYSLVLLPLDGGVGLLVNLTLGSEEIIWIKHKK